MRKQELLHVHALLAAVEQFCETTLDTEIDTETDRETTGTAELHSRVETQPRGRRVRAGASAGRVGHGAVGE